MKRREDLRRRFVHQWLEKAEQDFGAARYLLTERAPYPNVIAFHAQQAAEKLLKAYLTFHQTEFPKTHDIGRLLILVKRVDRDLAEALEDARILTPYGVDARYPDDLLKLSMAQATEATKLAERVRDTILAALPGADPER